MEGIKVELINGRWLVNKKKLNELSEIEFAFLRLFFEEAKKAYAETLEIKVILNDMHFYNTFNVGGF